MAVKRLKPTTPGSRFTVLNKKSEVSTDKPEKSLTTTLSRKGGRNSVGRMTMRQIGGGHRRKYRIIDFKRDKFNVEGSIKTIEYDPSRSAFISLVAYKDGEKRYIITPQGLKVGNNIVSGESVAPEVGNAMKLKHMPLGTIIHNIELRPGQGAEIARSAGTYAQLLARDGKYAIIKLPSSETRMVLYECMATIGSVSNSDHSLSILGKAGRRRWMGRRPRTSGVGMNPIDHPMGGGEGKKSGGHPRSRKGLYTKGKKTRRKKQTDRLIIERKKK